MASLSRARLNNLNDRAREFGQSDTLTLGDVHAVAEHYGHTCLCCGAKPAISIDHVIPLSRGGVNRVENLQLLCVECNKRKGTDATDYRNGNICPTPEVKQTKVGGRRPGAGRKPKQATILREQLIENKIAEAEKSFAFLVAVRDNANEATAHRVSSAIEILDRVIGKPVPMQPDKDAELFRLYSQNLKRFVYGDSESGETPAPESVQSLLHRLRAVAPTDSDTLVA